MDWGLESCKKQEKGEAAPRERGDAPRERGDAPWGPNKANTSPVPKHEGVGGIPGGIFQLKWLCSQQLKAFGDQNFPAQGKRRVDDHPHLAQ